MGDDTTTASARGPAAGPLLVPQPGQRGLGAGLVVAGVVVMCVLTIALDWHWATVVIAYGFVALVLTGPTLSPLGQFFGHAVRHPVARHPRAAGGGPAQALRPGHGRRLLASPPSC